jgi:ABC-2 type transport system permease protein
MTAAFWLPVATLWHRDLLRFWREKSRVLGFIGAPALFWLVLGSGSGNLGFFYPGALTLTVMFSAVFSMMSLIEDRREGFLLSMLVSPAPRGAMVLGKILGSSTLAWLQALLFLAFLPLTGYSMSPLALLELVGILFLVAFAFTSLSFLIAWKMDSTQGFHAIMNLLLFPLWMVSGSLFSLDGAHTWMQWLMRVNPLTYSVAAIRRVIQPDAMNIPDFSLSLGVTAAFAVALWLSSIWVASRPARESQA